MLFRSGNAVKRSKKATDVMDRIGTVNIAHKGETCQPLRNRLAPFHHSIGDCFLPQKGKDLLGDPVGSVGGGRSGKDANPDDDGTKTPLRPAGSMDNQ